MKNLWRALALAWLGGAGSPALMDDSIAMELAGERQADAAQAGPAEAFDIAGLFPSRPVRPAKQD